MSCDACKRAVGYRSSCPFCGELGDITRRELATVERQAVALEKLASAGCTSVPDAIRQLEQAHREEMTEAKRLVRELLAWVDMPLQPYLELKQRVEEFLKR